MLYRYLKKKQQIDVSAELSVYSHFVRQPGIRRQGDFKRHFRPNEGYEKTIISTLMLANKHERFHGKVTQNRAETHIFWVRRLRLRSVYTNPEVRRTHTYTSSL